MVNLVQHTEIDRNKWDRTIENSAFETIYPYSWYLDLVSPGWDALVLDDYRLIMPLTSRMKFGLPVLLQPILAQQLGIFGSESADPEEIKDFLRVIHSAFYYVDICLNRLNELPVQRFNAGMRINHELDLNAEPGSGTTAGYTTNTKRNLAKGENHGFEFREISSSEYLDFKIGNEKKPAAPADYLENLFAGLESAGRARAYGLFSGSEPEAASILAFSGSRVIYLNGSSSETGKENRAMFVLMHRLIEMNRGKYPVFDFEGSSIPGVGRFFEGFGAIKTNYPRLRMRKFPFKLF